MQAVYIMSYTSIEIPYFSFIFKAHSQAYGQVSPSDSWKYSHQILNETESQIRERQSDRIYINYLIRKIYNYSIVRFRQMQGVNQSELLKVSEAFVQGLLTLNQSNAWKIKQEKPILVYEQEIDDRIVVKAQLVINLPYETVLDFFSNPEFMRSLNDNIEKFEVIHNKTVRVIHIIMKMPGPISNREVVAVNTVRVEGNRAFVGNKSCNFPFKKDPDTVLAELHLAGFILEKIDANRTNLINISDVDVKGSIPGFVKNSLASKRVESIQTLEEKIRNHKK